MKRALLAGVAILVMLPAAAQDAKKGEALALQQCAACHGKDFLTPIDPTYPKLAGQYQDYLEKVLRDYKTGARNNAIMNGIAKPLTRDDIRNVSAYLAALPGPLSNQKR
ncbi:MAG: cytochrome c [Pseudomonadota bacterium]|nr:cytochrome c [Burkholderiaceae bacterium]MDQ3188522.1 cytochrome c [Pseudomonadota bacterium]